MSNFEDRLLSALKEDIMAPAPAPVALEPVRRSRRVVGLAAAVTGVAAATTVVALLYGGANTPAFAVTKGGDGTIEVQINSLTDASGLAAALREKGVDAVVDYVPAGQTCKPGRGARGKGNGEKSTVGMSANAKGATFSITKGMVGAGETLVLAVSGNESSDGPFATSIEVVSGPVSACEPTALPVPAKGGDQGPSTHEESGGGEPTLSTNEGTSTSG
ncbi:hypothetical protein ACIBG8_48150 [Nonomuraea sp. NPDC050556]|uniref:hypothetical protein n=1 Tax=Nonomuraea sp. NPDC050556 TaxID=3364369 RepID=UPI00378F4753